jgi:hypothetical protein
VPSPGKPAREGGKGSTSPVLPAVSTMITAMPADAIRPLARSYADVIRGHFILDNRTHKVRRNTVISTGHVR